MPRDGPEDIQCQIQQLLDLLQQIQKLNLRNDSDLGDVLKQQVDSLQQQYSRLLEDRDKDDDMAVARNKRGARDFEFQEDSVPKYGLPGLGEYEARRKQYSDEWKQECKKNMQLDAANSRRKNRGSSLPGGDEETLTNGRDNSPLDYAGVLAKKREEERSYRKGNDEPGTANMRSSVSDSHLNKENQNVRLNRMPMPYSTENFRSVNSAPNANIIPETNAYSVTETAYPAPPIGFYPAPGIPPSAPAAVFPYNQFYTYPGPGRPNTYTAMPVLMTAQGAPVVAVPMTAGLPPTQVPYVPGMMPSSNSQFPVGSHSHHREDSPPVLPFANPIRRNNGQSYDYQIYQQELAQQVEETKARKQKERDEEARFDRRLEEESKSWDPWGRDGAGAPRRDQRGNIIANRRVNGNPESEIHPTVYLDDPLPNVPLHHSMKFSRFDHDLDAVKLSAKTAHDKYMDELRQQIEEKKQREADEREKERLEEDKIAKRAAEQAARIQREYEEEQNKQRKREEELRRRNEQLAKQQIHQREEAEKERKAQRYKHRKHEVIVNGEADDNETTSSDADKDQRENSPPLPSLRVKQESEGVPEKRKNSTEVTERKHKSVETATMERNGSDSSKERILTQLSDMRRKLEQEQKQLQEKLRRQAAETDNFPSSRETPPRRESISRMREELKYIHRKSSSYRSALARGELPPKQHFTFSPVNPPHAEDSSDIDESSEDTR